jgi:hypothetical protein
MKTRAELPVVALAAVALCGCASHDITASKRPPKDHQGARLVRDQTQVFREPWREASYAERMADRLSPSPMRCRLLRGQVEDSLEAWDRFFARVGD